MRYLQQWLILIFVGAGGLKPALVLAQPAKEINFSTAYSSADLHWSIAGNSSGTNPNILSELIWRKQRGPQWQLGFRMPISRKFATSLQVRYQPILAGRVTDQDYAGDDRQDRIYEEELNADRGHLLSARLKAEYLLKALPAFRWNLSGGFHFLQEQFWLLGDQPATLGVKSSYRSRWTGAVAGTALNWFFNRYDFLTQAEGGLYRYRAVAGWNLIEAFAQPVSFRHRAGAYAFSARVEGGYRLREQLRLHLFAEGFHGDGWKGRDRAYYTDGSQLDTRLNWVTTSKLAFGLGINYGF